MRTRLLAALLLTSAAAFGADREFDRLVKAVETRFGTPRTHIPLLGVANFFVKVARPEGARGFKLAVFENLRTGHTDDAELDRLMAAASKGLRPIVRIRSRRDGERTYIYTGESGKLTTMLIAAFERNEANVIQVKLDTKALLRALESPERTGKLFGRGERAYDR